MGLIGDGIEVLKLANIAADAELHEKLGKFIDKAQELSARVEALEETNRQLEQQLKFKGQIVRLGGRTFVEGDDEQICSRCAEVDRKAVHYVVQRHEKMGNILMCPQ